MENLQDVRCRACYFHLGNEGEVLTCGQCKLWFHSKCVPDVEPLGFYFQFYLSVVKKEEPKHWVCHFCTKYRNQEPDVFLMFDKKKGKLVNPFVSDSSDSESELHMSFENNRIEREGLAQSSATAVSSVKDHVTSSAKILIAAQPGQLDESPNPTTYTLYLQHDGQRIVRDCLGHVFKPWLLCSFYGHYKCVVGNCPFTVTVWELRKMFVAGGRGSEKHNHEMPLALSSATDMSDYDHTDDDSEEDSDVSLPESLPAPGSTPYTTPTRYRRSLQEQVTRYERHSHVDHDKFFQDGVQSPSPILQATSATPANTPARIKMSAKHLSFCSPSSSSDDTSLNTAINQGRFTNSNHVSNNNITCRTDSSDEEPECTKPIPDSLARKGNREPENASITYTLTDGLASGNQARLTDSQGYSYQIKYKLGLRVFWTCTQKVGRCSATVIQQRQDKFTKGTATHNHEPGKSQDTPNLPLATEKLSVKSSSIVHQSKKSIIVSSAATIKTTQQNVKSATTVKTTQQNVKSAATVKPTQQKVKSVVTSGITYATNHRNNDSDISSSSEDTSNCNESKTFSNSDESSNCPWSTGLLAYSSKIMYQEVYSCAISQRRAQSVLIDDTGYIYKSKKVLMDGKVTQWKCTHRGPGGKCKSYVLFDYLTELNEGLDDSFFWFFSHSTSTATVPHNHEPDTEAVIMVKMKAMIHLQVFGHGHKDLPIRNVIDLAVGLMNKWEIQYIQHAPMCLDSKPLRNFVNRLLDHYWESPYSSLQRYVIHPDTLRGRIYKNKEGQ